VLGRLRKAPCGRAGEAELEARREAVLALVGTLKALVERIKRLEERIAKAQCVPTQMGRSSSLCL
jgi:hypothetical protein